MITPSGSCHPELSGGFPCRDPGAIPGRGKYIGSRLHPAVPPRVTTREPSVWSRLAPGVRVRRLVNGAGTALRLYRLDPGTDRDLHDHDFAELGMLLVGSGVMLVDGVERRLEAGDSFFLPARIPHAFRADARGEPVLFLNVEADEGSAVRRSMVDDLVRLASDADWPSAIVQSSCPDRD
jgi:quercetin dioxygenase-like cupin family protein